MKYLIGDIQGCYDELMALLEFIQFDPLQDTLWFAGDLVNRGPKSLETLRFVSNLGGSHQCVLGNHDLHLLALAEGSHAFKINDDLKPILKAADRDALLHWLRHRPLALWDEAHALLLVHAGVLPQWSLEDIKAYAKEVETCLQGENYVDLLHSMYGNTPSTWNASLTGFDRLRTIINAFTRLRYCTKTGEMDFKHKGPSGTQPETLIPWFATPGRKTQHNRIAFGHWASLQGDVDVENIIALDTGCVWGGALRAYRIDDETTFDVPAIV